MYVFPLAAFWGDKISMYTVLSSCCCRRCCCYSCCCLLKCFCVCVCVQCMYIGCGCAHMLIPKPVLNLDRFKWYPVFVPNFFFVPSIRSYLLPLLLPFDVVAVVICCAATAVEPPNTHSQPLSIGRLSKQQQKKNNDPLVSVKHNYKPNVFYLIDSILVEMPIPMPLSVYVWWLHKNIDAGPIFFSPCVWTFPKRFNVRANASDDCVICSNTQDEIPHAYTIPIDLEYMHWQIFSSNSLMTLLFFFSFVRFFIVVVA